MADVVFQGVTAFKSVRNYNFVAFLSHCYFSVTVSARAVYAVISYLEAIVFKKKYQNSNLGYMQGKMGVRNLIFHHSRHYSGTRILLHIECTRGKFVMINRTVP